MKRGFQSTKDLLSPVLNKIEKRARKKVYPFQEACVEIARLAKIPTGLAFALWKRIGTGIYGILSQLKQGEIKKPEVYIKHLLKK